MEMTGLDSKQDKILEIATIVTGWDLSIKATYEATIKVSESILKARMKGRFWNKNKKVRDALIAASKKGRDIADVEQELIDFVQKNYTKRTIYLAGNSIHQDRKFLEQEMPKLNKMFHYRLLDVSAYKIYFQEVLGMKLEKPEAHRALDDISGSISEFKQYIGMIQK